MTADKKSVLIRSIRGIRVLKQINESTTQQINNYMSKIQTYLSLLLIAAVAAMTVSCDNKETYPESPDLTIIYGIKILNAGESGTQVLTGTIDEINKEITFPDVDTLTDFSGIRFEAELPEGAQLDEEVYNFSMAQTDARIKRTIKVVNGIRKREYYVTIKKDIPVWGADFETRLKIYNFSNSGATVYPDLAAALTRSADMDAEHVLIVSRDTKGAHLLRLEDLKNGDVSQPIILNTDGLDPGAATERTFVVSSGRLAQGHIYLCNLAVLGSSQTFRVFHYASPTAAPELVASLTSGNGGIPTYATNAGRFGDGMSVNLDENGNGYIFVGNNRGTVAADPYVLRLSVTGFSTVSSPTLVNTPTYAGWWANYRKVDGADEYVYAGYTAAIQLVTEDGGSIYTMENASVPLQGNDAAIVSFNRERYLIMQSSTSGTEAATLYVYNITAGATTAEALALFEAGNKMALYSFPLGGAGVGVYAASLGIAATEDTLYIMGAAPGAGFVVLEAPKAVKADAE
jgi:hypothetical protein